MPDRSAQNHSESTSGTAPPQTIFIHIEKTAGSSLLASLIKPNTSHHERVGGPRAYLPHRNASCISGHVPYGLHWLTTRPVRYFTMLRDPIDRAVSWYYFIKDLVRTDLWKPHPLREYADSVTLVEFYQNPRYANMQTRFLAGWTYHKIYPLMHHSAAFQRQTLRAAKRHLRACAAFGLQHRYDESVMLFRDVFGWDKYQPVPPQARTKKRPSLQEIDDLNPTVLPRLRASHQLDLELFEYATEHFDEQLGEGRGTEHQDA